MGLDADASNSSKCVCAWHAMHIVRHFLANINGRRQAGTSPAQSAFSAAATTAASTAASKSRLWSAVFLISSSRTISRFSNPTGCVGARCALLRTPAFQTLLRAGMAWASGTRRGLVRGCVDPKWLGLHLLAERGTTLWTSYERCQIRHCLLVQLPAG